MILAAARSSFAARGFTGTTLRGIAGAAGVDPALIHHYFESKRSLFLATVQLPIDPPALVAEVMHGDRGTLGPRLVAKILQTWDSEQRPSLVAVARTALGDPQMSRPLQEFFSLEVIGEAFGDLDPDPEESRRRAGLVASTIIGLLVGRYVLELPALLDQRTEDLVAAIGPVLQRYVDGDFGRQSSAVAVVGEGGHG